MQKKSGDICETAGYYLCLYHLKNKIKIFSDHTFPRCDFHGIKCEGFWHLKKEIKVKTHEEKQETQNRKRYKSKRKNHDMDYIWKPHSDEKYKFGDWKEW
jgi:hypothetical protein